MLMSLTFLFFINNFILTKCEVYDADNATDIFEIFKEKYDKNYKNDAEEAKRYHNFIINLNKVSSLNEKELDKNTFYIVNQYADLNPEEIEDHYAIQVKPFFKVSNGEAEYLGRQKNPEINPSELYDLDNAAELYKDFKKKYNKKNATKKIDRQIRYYRFIKTLVEINRNRMNGYENGTLDENADVLKEPNEYFY